MNLYFILLLLFSLYSYTLVDPNFTLFNHPLWTNFRNFIVNIGYYHRDLSWLIYLAFVIALFGFHLYFLKNYQKINPWRLGLIISFLTIFSYPFLSHDFFNYMFDARILTFYGKNPYYFKALDFPQDSWLRFMHWTHRSYPYGPIFLLITFIPSFLSFGKFFLSFFFFKITWAGFYLLGGYFLAKINKKYAIIFLTHPLVIIEGLINNHNDLIALSLAITGIFFLTKNKNLSARFFLIFSAAIKYLTFPLIFLPKPGLNIRRLNLILKIIFGLTIFSIIYLSFIGEIQPWYFLVFFTFLPYFKNIITYFNLFFFGLLLSYYPYIRFGGWDSVEKIDIKHWIIIISFFVNILMLFGIKLLKHEKKG